MSSSSKDGVHILVFPYPAQGHMLSLLDLSLQLSLRGLTITVLITPKNLPLLTTLLSANPSIQTLILPFPTDPSIPPGIEHVKDLGNIGNVPMMRALSRLEQPIIQWFKSHHNPPVAILSDIFLGWTHQLASDLGIPRIVYSPCSAFLVGAFDYLWLKCEDVKPGTAIRFHDLPRTPCFTWDQLPSLFRRYRELLECNDKIAFDLIKTSMAANGLGWACVFNSFWALENEFLDYFSKTMGRPRVYGVGPLNMVDGSEKLRGGDDKGDSSDGVISWLDQWDDGSVLYVCFGSQVWLKKAQMEALATGLERSGVRFVWVVKPLSAQRLADGYGSVPDGFEDRVSGRGFILKGWAPQTAILSHPTVGTFLCHCGWNSILEAIGAGAMILGWPMEADHFVNAKLLMEYESAAVLVCEGGDTVPNSDGLAQKITEAMHGDAMIGAKELRNKALEAVSVGGSSIKDLDELVQQLSQLKIV